MAAAAKLSITDPRLGTGQGGAIVGWLAGLSTERGINSRVSNYKDDRSLGSSARFSSLGTMSESQPVQSPGESPQGARSKTLVPWTRAYRSSRISSPRWSKGSACKFASLGRLASCL